MQRRDFVKSTALGAAAGLTASSPLIADEAPAQASKIIVDGLDTSLMNEGFVGLLKTGGVDCVHKSMGDHQSYGAMYSFLDQHKSEIVPATTVREIREAKRQGKMSVTFGVQHANLLEALLNKDPYDTYGVIVAGLRGFYEQGLRIHGICYNVANTFGGGCLDPTVPLTKPGRRLVEEIHKLNIILDVGGHTGEQTSLNAIEMSSGVLIVCTHSNVHALNPNMRAISDRLIEAIAGTGGVFGVTAISDFLVRNPRTARQHGKKSPQAELGLYLDQLEYVRRLVGSDHVAIGPDFVWGWGETFDHKGSVSITFPSDTLSDGAVTTVKGFENISELPNVIRGLEGRGWSRGDLDKVLGDNWMRVYGEVWRG